MKESTSDSRIGVSNDNNGTKYDKSNTPETYENMWISYSSSDCSVEKENLAKNGGSEKSAVTTPTISNSNLTINAYQYNSSDGPVIEAYWEDSNAKRFCAFSYFAVKEPYRTENLDIFKNILSTFQFTQ